jgi:hypothetical protein
VQIPVVAGASGVFGVALRADGTQLTFDGAPLSAFIKDKKPSRSTGQGACGVWWVVDSDRVGPPHQRKDPSVYTGGVKKPRILLVWRCMPAHT